MEQLARILFQMQSLDPYRDGAAIGQFNDDLSFADDRRLVLAYLIALRQIGIEIVLAVDHRAPIDPGVEAKAGADRLPYAFLVDDRQHARHRRVDERDVAVGLATEFRRCSGKQLRIGSDLAMAFQADDDFPVTGWPIDQ